MNEKLKVFTIRAMLLLMLAAPQIAWAKQSSSIDVPENKELFASIGDLLIKVRLRESLPNAFGRADVFGRKRDRGFVEIRFMGIASDGRAIFRRRTVDVYSNETTMSRSGMQFGSANIQPNGNGAQISGYIVGPQQATVEAMPPDTIEFALDLSKSNIITIEDRKIEIRKADEGGVTFMVSKR